MKLYSIEKGNLIKGRRVFRIGSSIELSDAEAARFRAVGGELSEAAAASTEMVSLPTPTRFEAESPSTTDVTGTKARRGR
jgi:hypothetical protein